MKHKSKIRSIFAGAMVLFLFGATAPLVLGQADFSGKWALNEDKSNMGEFRFFRAVKLDVQQMDGKLQVARTRIGRDDQERVMEETVNLDGSKSVNERGMGTSTSTAKWSGDKKSLTINYSVEFERNGETRTMERTEVWSLNGGMLQIASTAQTPNGEMSVNLIYDKQ